ncbi:MAG: SIS domain-containing protein [Methylococcaceae bacterium]|jgi:D-sedoheptulose 7-phosphate isomerase
MSLQDRIINHFTDNIQTQQQAMASLLEVIEFSSQRLVAALLNDQKILVCGSGSSALNAQHFSSALLNPFERERPALPALMLSTDLALLGNTALDDIFAKQIRALGNNGDLLMIFSNGDKTANISKATKAAHDKDMAIIALTGDNGRAISPLLNESDIEIRVPSLFNKRIEETHLLIIHCLVDLVDHQIFGG